MSKLVSKKTDKRIGYWLLIMLVLVALMIVLGGATRLTNSGLSITEWRPITGALPPLSHAQWLKEFEKYKQIPEFLAEHPDMELDGFKFIYFMEWTHRQLGRLIGLAYALPFLWWAGHKRLPGGRFWRFFSILLLIGFQGFIGWWMVRSGLGDGRVDVSHFRLATHLAIAFFILGLIFNTWRSHIANWPLRDGPVRLRRHSALLIVLVYLQIILGALVAGTHAGKTYNTWPLMDGKILPDGYGSLNPFWLNIVDNIAAIQFNHRSLAYAILIASLWLLWRVRGYRRLYSSTMMLTAVVFVQLGLGIWTLLAVTPLHLALAHQFTAILVFLAALAMYRTVHYPR